MAKLFIREINGDYNLEGETDEPLYKIVERVQRNGGYYTKDVFIPYHRIEYLRLEGVDNA